MLPLSLCNMACPLESAIHIGKLLLVRFWNEQFLPVFILWSVLWVCCSALEVKMECPRGLFLVGQFSELAVSRRAWQYAQQPEGEGENIWTSPLTTVPLFSFLFCKRLCHLSAQWGCSILWFGLVLGRVTYMLFFPSARLQPPQHPPPERRHGKRQKVRH